MELTLATVNELQRELAKQAAWKRYYDGLNKQDRPGWLGGKCPVSEYYGNVSELGAANYLGIPTEDIVLFSTNPMDYTKPDAGVWEFKAGTGWTRNDVRKGARYILWAKPVELDETFDCGIATCGTRSHKRLSGDVLIRGWNHVEDPAYNMHGKFFPKAINRLDTIPWGRK